MRVAFAASVFGIVATGTTTCLRTLAAGDIVVMAAEVVSVRSNCYFEEGLPYNAKLTVSYNRLLRPVTMNKDLQLVIENIIVNYTISIVDCSALYDLVENLL